MGNQNAAAAAGTANAVGVPLLADNTSAEDTSSGAEQKKRRPPQQQQLTSTASSDPVSSFIGSLFGGSRWSKVATVTTDMAKPAPTKKESDALTAKIGEYLGALHASRRAFAAKAKLYTTLARELAPKERAGAPKRKIPPAAVSAVKIVQMCNAGVDGVMRRVGELESLNMMLMQGEVNAISVGILRDILSASKHHIAAAGGEEAIHALELEYADVMDSIKMQNEGIEEAANTDSLTGTMPMSNRQISELLSEYDDDGGDGNDTVEPASATAVVTAPLSSSSTSLAPLAQERASATPRVPTKKKTPTMTLMQ